MESPTMWNPVGVLETMVGRVTQGAPEYRRPWATLWNRVAVLWGVGLWRKGRFYSYDGFAGIILSEVSLTPIALLIKPYVPSR